MHELEQGNYICFTSKMVNRLASSIRGAIWESILLKYYEVYVYDLNGSILIQKMVVDVVLLVSMPTIWTLLSKLIAKNSNLISYYS